MSIENGAIAVSNPIINMTLKLFFVVLLDIPYYLIGKMINETIPQTTPHFLYHKVILPTSSLVMIFKPIIKNFKQPFANLLLGSPLNTFMRLSSSMPRE